MEMESAIGWAMLRGDEELELGRRDCLWLRWWRRNRNVRAGSRGLKREMGGGDGLGCGIGTCLWCVHAEFG